MKTRLTLSNYQPNPSDPRVQRRLRKVLTWADDFRLSKRPRRVGYAEMRKVFGNESQLGLGRWVRANLVVQIGNYQIGKMPYEYRLNQAGYKKIYMLLNESPPSDEQVMLRKFKPLIDGTETPEYVDKGDRRYHPVQNIPKVLRRQVFQGWYDYDIETSAPTLIYQYATSHWKWINLDDSAVPFPTVNELIENKKAVRDRIALITGVSIADAKGILASLFFRANLAPSPRATIFRALGCDCIRHNRLINDPWVLRLISDVRSMWHYAFLRENRERMMRLLERLSKSDEQNGGAKAEQIFRMASSPIGKLLRVKPSKRRQGLYVALERKVVDSMLEELAEPENRLILMHDGFMSKRRVDSKNLERAVLKKTGFLIRLSETRFEAEENGNSEEEFDWTLAKEDAFRETE